MKHAQMRNTSATYCGEPWPPTIYLTGPTDCPTCAAGEAKQEAEDVAWKAEQEARWARGEPGYYRGDIGHGEFGRDKPTPA